MSVALLDEHTMGSGAGHLVLGRVKYHHIDRPGGVGLARKVFLIAQEND